MRPLDWALLAGLAISLGWNALTHHELRAVVHALSVHVNNRARHRGPGDDPER